jgi:hypothetical protein
MSKKLKLGIALVVLFLLAPVVNKIAHDIAFEYETSTQGVNGDH